MVLIINSFLPIVFGSPWKVEIHIAVVAWCAFCCSFCMKFVRLAQSDIIYIYKIVVVCGCAVGLYAIFKDFHFFLSMLLGSGDYEEYYSFLRQRNLFAAYCYLCTVPTLYLYYTQRKKVFLILILFGGLHIFLTTSRNSFLSFGMLIGISTYLKTQKRYYFYGCIIVLVAAIFVGFGGFENFYDRFRHETNEGTDSSMIRYMMWELCVNYLTQKSAWLSGFGFGSVSKYLLPLFDFGSSHNMYIDVLFWGGIVLVVLILIPLGYSLKVSLRNKDEAYRVTMTGAIVSYFFYCFFEAGMTLFLANFFSLTSTLLLIMMPLNYAGETTKNGVKRYADKRFYGKY